MKIGGGLLAVQFQRLFAFVSFLPLWFPVAPGNCTTIGVFSKLWGSKSEAACLFGGVEDVIRISVLGPTLKSQAGLVNSQRAVSITKIYLDKIRHKCYRISE